MTRRSWWLPSPRVGVVILCVAVVLTMGYWAGWHIAHTPGPMNMTGAEIGFTVMAGTSCVIKIMAMAFVRAIFKFHSVRCVRCRALGNDRVHYGRGIVTGRIVFWDGRRCTDDANGDLCFHGRIRFNRNDTWLVSEALDSVQRPSDKVVRIEICY